MAEVMDWSEAGRTPREVVMLERVRQLERRVDRQAKRGMSRLLELSRTIKQRDQLVKLSADLAQILDANPATVYIWEKIADLLDEIAKETNT